MLELARSEYVARRENVIAVGNSGTGKTHIALGLGLAACQKGLSVGFITAAALVHELIEARDEKRLLRLQRQLAGYKLLIIDELGYVPLSTTGAELLPPEAQRRRVLELLAFAATLTAPAETIEQPSQEISENGE